MGRVRAFIAVDFPSEVVKEVARVQEVLGKKKFIGKMTELENLHLTMKFLGDVSLEDLEGIRKELRNIRLGVFEARLAEPGTFNYKGWSSIVWIKVGGRGIFDLQKRVDVAMERMGFEGEKRFMSHLTVARVKYIKDKRSFKGYVDKLGVKGLNFLVDGFRLMSSELKATGPVYREIERFNLV